MKTMNNARHKRIYLIIAVLMVLCLCMTQLLSTIELVPVSAGSSVSYQVKGGYIYFDKSLGMITGADKSITLAKIPKKISNVVVKVIGDEAFKNCTKLKKVTLPSKLKTIGDSAFYGCSALEYIDIPAKVTAIGNKAFEVTVKHIQGFNIS
ncbi:MAG: leucine-rich repeat domain-containing protein [Lachnospiraceae bacterium]|nr:leucine-rich repeat domain-containing protein [Lachnospiraceae bacterium]